MTGAYPHHTGGTRSCASAPPALVPLMDAVQNVARIVRDAGGTAYIVGGAVRDMILGNQVKDIDIEVFGLTSDSLINILSAEYKLDLVGMSFGVIKLHHFDIDVALPRRESKIGIGHRGFVIESDPGISIEEAASRRDFTINAIYYNPLTDELIDPYGGRADLGSRVLRHVSDKFVEDPLRVLRGMQFIARFGLSPAPETVAICQTMTPEDLPPERLFEEWAKLLTKGHCISKGLDFLRAVGWTRYYPELDALIGCEQDPKWHGEGDVWNHTLLCLDAFARRRDESGADAPNCRTEGAAECDGAENLIVGFAVLCHDFGKPATTRFEDGHIRSRGHDSAGVEPTLSFLRRLTNEDRILREVPPLVEHHMQPYALWRANAGDSAIRRLAAKVVRIDRLIRVACADSEGSHPQYEKLNLELEKPKGGDTHEDLLWLASAAERLRIAASAPKPILLGRDLIELGYKPSADFGIWLKACFEAQLDGKFTDKVGAIQYFKENIRR